MGSVVLATAAPARASVLLSDVVAVNDALTGSYADQAALNRGNSGAYVADSSGNFYNGTGLLSPGVDGTNSTMGALTLTSGINTFYVLFQDTGSSNTLSFFFGGADPDTATADLTGVVDDNSSSFTAFGPSRGTMAYVTPGGLSTTVGDQVVTLTSLAVSNQGAGPFPNGTQVGYSSAMDSGYVADVFSVTLDVEPLSTQAVPEPATLALVGAGLVALVMGKRRRAA